jgi:hypothetical protein
MQLKLIPKHVQVTQTNLNCQVGLVTSTNFVLHYRITGDKGVAVKVDTVTLPIADIDLFNEKNFDAAKLNAVLSTIGVEVDETQPLTPQQKFQEKQARTKAAIADAEAKRKQKNEKLATPTK